jgi:hypothetical protein
LNILIVSLWGLVVVEFSFSHKAQRLMLTVTMIMVMVVVIVVVVMMALVLMAIIQQYLLKNSMYDVSILLECLSLTLNIFWN